MCKYKSRFIYICICVYLYVYVNFVIGSLVKRVACSPMAWETSVQSQGESYQRLKNWFLMSTCLTLYYKAGIKGKWSNPGKGVAPHYTSV